MSDERDRNHDLSSAGAEGDEHATRPTPQAAEGYELAPEPEPVPPARSPSTPDSRAEPSASVKASGPHVPLDRPTPFVAGFGGIRFTASLLGVLMLATLVVVGVRAGSLGFQQVLVHLTSAVLQVAAYGSLGALAAIAAARCVGTRVAEPELFALRMLAATAAYQLLFATGTPIPTRIDDRILGMVGYVTTVWLLFKLNPRETGMVVLWHFGLAGLLWLSVVVSARVIDPKPAPPEPRTGAIGVPQEPSDPVP